MPTGGKQLPDTDTEGPSSSHRGTTILPCAQTPHQGSQAKTNFPFQMFPKQPIPSSGSQGCRLLEVSRGNSQVLHFHQLLQGKKMKEAELA